MGHQGIHPGRNGRDCKFQSETEEKENMEPAPVDDAGGIVGGNNLITKGDGGYREDHNPNISGWMHLPFFNGGLMSSWHSYPKIYAMGHRAIQDLFLDPVIVEEKVDGSQFSFGRFDGELKVRSKGKVMIPDAPERLFKEAVETAESLPLKDGWTYRGECLQKPKHNALAYDRIPKGNVILFDINSCEEGYLSPEEKQNEADRLGLEVVPLLHVGTIKSVEEVLELLESTSILGGQKIEGMVFKNYNRFGPDKKVLMGKHVSEKFKEVHKKTWGESNPKQGDILIRLIKIFKTEARWEKAIIHMEERGELEKSPRDIGNLIKEVKKDLRAECEDEIKQVLFNWAIDSVLRGSTGGLPEWYKNKLLSSQFSE